MILPFEVQFKVVYFLKAMGISSRGGCAFGAKPIAKSDFFIAGIELRVLYLIQCNYFKETLLSNRTELGVLIP